MRAHTRPPTRTDTASLGSARTPQSIVSFDDSLPRSTMILQSSDSERNMGELMAAFELAEGDMTELALQV